MISNKSKSGPATLFTFAILSLAALGFQASRNKVIIGEIRVDNIDPGNITGLLLELKSDSTTFAATILDINGKFQIRSNIAKDLDLFYSGIGVSETYLTTIKASDPDTLRLFFTFPKQYSKHSGKVECPKCRKSDNTIQILSKPIVIKTLSNSGDTITLPYDENYYYSGSDVSSPIDANWFCKRDKIKF